DGLPAAARAAVAREETRLGPADRGKAGAALLAAGNVERGVRLLRKDPPANWPAEQRAAWQLALARGEARLGRHAAAEKAAAAVPRDGSVSDFEARLFLADARIDRARGKKPKLDPGDPAADAARKSYQALTAPQAPQSVRLAAFARLVRLEC